VSGQQPIRFPILGLCRGHHVSGQFGAGRLLVPADPLEVVANVLLVKRWLRPSRCITGGGPKSGRIRRQGFVDPDQFIADQPEFKLCVREQYAARLRVCCRPPVKFQADRSKLLCTLATNARDRLVEGDIFVVSCRGFCGGRKNGRRQPV
jgi:hypothetical protein